jgi:hypothetical protein
MGSQDVWLIPRFIDRGSAVQQAERPLERTAFPRGTNCLAARCRGALREGAAGQSQASLRPVSGQSQASLRPVPGPVPGQSQASPRPVPGQSQASPRPVSGPVPGQSQARPGLAPHDARAARASHDAYLSRTACTLPPRYAMLITEPHPTLIPSNGASAFPICPVQARWGCQVGREPKHQLRRQASARGGPKRARHAPSSGPGANWLCESQSAMLGELQSR